MSTLLDSKGFAGTVTKYYEAYIMKIILENVLMVVAGLLLLAADWLAFHDFREAHTVRDWLMLFGSILVFSQYARMLWKQNFGHR